MRLNQVTVTATDIESSARFYETLGLEMIVKSAHYARFACPEGGSTFSIHLGDAAPGDATTVYFECEDLDARVALLKNKGLVFESNPVDQFWLWREAYLRDPAGNRLCLYHAGKNRLDPPWRLPKRNSQ
jgi:catechol 2,3-dioxygenase-like lactoylglutathione lyase family enzyme